MWFFSFSDNTGLVNCGVRYNNNGFSSRYAYLSFNETQRLGGFSGTYDNSILGFKFNFYDGFSMFDASTGKDSGTCSRSECVFTKLRVFYVVD